MLRLDWDTQTTPYVDNTCYITIRTGRSRAYRNVLNGIAVQDPAKAARLRQDMDALLLAISESGGSALTTPNIPEMVVARLTDEHEAVITHGIVFTGHTGKRLVGEFKLVIAMMDEMDAVLDVFKLEDYVKAALSQ